MRLGSLFLVVAMAATLVGCANRHGPHAAPAVAAPPAHGRFTMTLAVEGPGIDMTVTGTGAFDGARGDVTYSLDLSGVDHLGTLAVTAVDGTTYVRSDAVSDKWLRGATPAVDPEVVLDAIDDGAGETVRFDDGTTATLTVAVEGTGSPIVITPPPPEQVVDVGAMLAGDERTPH